MINDLDSSEKIKIGRIIDANLNRLKEGIRVAEDICRYGYNNLSAFSTLKDIRHKAKINTDCFIEYRDVELDVGKKSTSSEMSRSCLNDICIANLKRAQESARVLEECFKLIDTKNSELFKDIRYQLYSVEKEL